MSATISMPARVRYLEATHSADDLRRRRVVLLVVAMVLMGLADLQLTLTYMRSVGMIELNPLARAMIDLRGEPQLIRFKLLSIALSAGLLFLLRRHSIAERCAWLSCAALLFLTFHWVRYNDRPATPDSVVATLAQVDMIDHRWVAIRD